MKQLSFFSLVLLTSLCSKASVIYTQPPNGSGSLYQSAVNGTDYDQMTWDLFRLTNATAITEIHWRGGYLYGGTYSGHVTNWTIALYGDIANGYQPDIVSPPVETYNIQGTAAESAAGNFGGTAMYDYTLALPTPFQAAAGSNYWLLIQANQSGIPEWGIALGSTLHGKSFRRIAGVGDWWYYLANGDTAFTLLTADGPTVMISANAAPPAAGQIIGGGAYPLGSIALLTAKPASGFGFVNWTENGTEVSTASGYQFTANADRTLVANFAPRYSVVVSASPGYGGSVTGGGTFNSNAVVTLIATAGSGYSFVNWTEFGVEQSSSVVYTFNATADRTLAANFTSSPATSTFDFDTGMPPLYPGQGLPGSQTKDSLTAYFSVLSGNWSVQNNFYGWIPGVFSGNFLYPSTWGSTLAIEFSRPITNVSLAFFTGDLAGEYDIPTIIRVSAYTNSAMTDPVAMSTTQGDWLTGSYPEGTISLGPTTPFTKIKVDMPAGQGLVSYIYWLDNIVAQQVVEPPATISASSSPGAGGTVSGDGVFAYEATVILTAIPNTGYAFASWTEDGIAVSLSPNYTFTATTNRTLIANFVQLPATFDIMLAALPSNGGTVVGAGTFTNGENITVTATANSGYDFVKWTADNATVSASTNYSFTVTTNRLLIANFAAAVIPRLEIQSLNGAIMLSWPTNSIGFSLEQNTTLNLPNWTTVVASPAVVGTNNQVKISIVIGNSFFRLSHP